MSAFNQVYNFDNVFERTAYIAVLKSLTKICTYTQIISDGDSIIKQTIELPFYPRLTGSERFLQDEFLNDVIKDPSGEFAETQYDKVPRGIVSHTGTSINTSARTNPMVYAKRLVEDGEGQLKAYRQLLSSLPINMSFECTIICSSTREMYIIAQELKKLYYVATVVQFTFDGIRIPGIWKFPEEIGREQSTEYTFGDTKNYTLTFSIELQTFLPVFNEKDSIFEGNRMQGGITNNIKLDNVENFPNTNNIVKDELEDNIDPFVKFLSNGAVD